MSIGWSYVPLISHSATSNITCWAIMFCYEQCHHKSPREQARRNTLQNSDVRSCSARSMGGEASALSAGRTHIGHLQQSSGLAEQDYHRSCGVATTSHNLSGNHSQIWPPSDRSLHQSKECSCSAILHPVLDTRDRRDQRLLLQVASSPPVCLSSNTPNTEGNLKDLGREGGRHPRRPVLALKGMVRRPHESVHYSSLEDSSEPDRPTPGGSLPPGTPMVPTSRLALERDLLKKDHFSAPVISTLLASRRRSTTRIYDAIWSSFRHWCSNSGIVPTNASIPQVLNFLQAGLEAGLAVNTLCRQVTALATVLTFQRHGSLSQHPRVRCFFRGASNLRPPPVHRYPSWDLSLVLQALTAPPFKPLGSMVPVKFLNFKVSLSL